LQVYNYDRILSILLKDEIQTLPEQYSFYGSGRWRMGQQYYNNYTLPLSQRLLMEANKGVLDT